MGLDLYIQARIREKKTGKVISCGADKVYDEENEGFFEICWWCGWDFCDIRTKMIEISNQYGGTNYIDSDIVIPFPQSALREIYAFIVKRSYLSDDEHLEVLPCNIEWQERYSYEQMNLVNAEKLHGLFWTLNEIKNDNEISIENKFIQNEDDWKKLKDNPQAYEWELRIFNSY